MTMGKLRADAPETSRLALLKARPKIGTQRDRILKYVIACLDYGATDDEISADLCIPANSVRPRRVELVEGGWIHDSGKLRKNGFGNSCIVWVRTQKSVDG